MAYPELYPPNLALLGMAGACRNRTHPTPCGRHNGFEDRGAHQHPFAPIRPTLYPGSDPVDPAPRHVPLSSLVRKDGWNSRSDGRNR